MPEPGGTIIYSVSQGSYSNYRVRCLFTTRELADAHAAELEADEDSYGEVQVEEFSLLDRVPTRAIWYTGMVRMNDDGTDPPKHLEPQKKIGYEYEQPTGLTKRAKVDLLYSPPYNNVSSNHTYVGPGRYSLEVESLDRDAVGKTISEMVAQWKANGFKLQGARPWR